MQNRRGRPRVGGEVGGGGGDFVHIIGLLLKLGFGFRGETTGATPSPDWGGGGGQLPYVGTAAGAGPHLCPLLCGGQ